MVTRSSWLEHIDWRFERGSRNLARDAFIGVARVLEDLITPDFLCRACTADYLARVSAEFSE